MMAIMFSFICLIGSCSMFFSTIDLNQMSNIAKAISPHMFVNCLYDDVNAKYFICTEVKDTLIKYKEESKKILKKDYTMNVAFSYLELYETKNIYCATFNIQLKAELSFGKQYVNNIRIEIDEFYK